MKYLVPKYIGTWNRHAVFLLPQSIARTEAQTVVLLLRGSTPSSGRQVHDPATQSPGSRPVAFDPLPDPAPRPAPAAAAAADRLTDAPRPMIPPSHHHHPRLRHPSTRSCRCPACAVQPRSKQRAKPGTLAAARRRASPSAASSQIIPEAPAEPLFPGSQHQTKQPHRGRCSRPSPPPRTSTQASTSTQLRNLTPPASHATPYLTSVHVVGQLQLSRWPLHMLAPRQIIYLVPLSGSLHLHICRYWVDIRAVAWPSHRSLPGIAGRSTWRPRTAPNLSRRRLGDCRFSASSCISRTREARRFPKRRRRTMHPTLMRPPLRSPSGLRLHATLGGEVITGLPRSQTFARQQSEQRMNLAPVPPSADERRAASVDRRSRSRHTRHPSELGANPRVSAPGLLGSSQDDEFPHHGSLHTGEYVGHGLAVQSMDTELFPEPGKGGDGTLPPSDGSLDAQSMTTSQHEAMINDELERKWILNLSMHFRDRSKREKFFVTYREKEHLWRRVTISLDYRYATPNSLEMDLFQTRYQREKSAKIYEAIRESLADIKFYDTVTNLKLETTDGRLHVHVVEDGNTNQERDIVFDSHMSGFVYKVNVHGHVLIKKEIPSQDTIDEFLYEVNALNSLRYSNDVVRFYGVVVDDKDDHVKGLLISYASQGALIDIIYDHCKDGNYALSWATKERWARQIVQGLSDVHDSGFVQGDFTLSNIVIDEFDNAKIIDINRRGCPVGWEPPEATALINAGHRISMYIGVKSDLYQLGMVLWGLAMEEDEPEAHGRPLMLGPEINVPDWYRQMTEICLSADPRMRQQASTLLRMFPHTTDEDERAYAKPHPVTVDDGHSLNEYFVDGYRAMLGH
ncbi:hypothetical protein ACCO45_002373 [Purpureocillium lilacinum]|uniref:Uncharacterized protein n=1 Tax=Purpureocillium lilacinum TaxID=33203 RepID=A0ACC4EBY8_PURLI